MHRIRNHRRGRVTHSLKSIATDWFEKLVEEGPLVFTCLGPSEGIVARMTRPVSGMKSFYLITNRQEFDQIRSHAERRKARLDWFWYKKGHHPGSDDYIHATVADTVTDFLRRPHQK